MFKQNKNQEVLKWGIGAGFFEALYVLLVVLFMNSMNVLVNKSDEVVIGVLMLLLLIISVLISGFLVFGKPFLLFMDGKKKQALSTFFVSLGTIFVIFLVVLVVIIL